MRIALSVATDCASIELAPPLCSRSCVGPASPVGRGVNCAPWLAEKGLDEHLLQ